MADKKEIDILRVRVRELERIAAEKVSAEQALCRERNFLDSIFSSIQDGISVLDTDLKIVRVNSTMEKWYAHAMPLVGKKCHEAYHCHATPCDTCPTIAVLKKKTSVSSVVPKRGLNGRIVGWLELHSFPLFDTVTKEITGVIEYVRDISDRRKTEEEIKEVVTRMGTVIERVDEGITLSDMNGHFLIFNSKMGEITGYTMQEANASNDFLGFLCLDPGAHRSAACRLGEVIEKGDVSDIEMAIRAKDGSVKTLLISTSLLHQKSGDMFLSVYHDISVYKKMGQLKDEFISTVSHELRTPLSIVKEGISLLLDEIPGRLTADQAKVLTSAKINVERLTRMINMLLDMAKFEAGKDQVVKKDVDLSGLIRQVSQLFDPKASAKGLEIRLDLQSSVGTVRADPDMMTQVITNLLDNAIKFTDEGHVEIAVRYSGGSVECSVSDTGIGISKEHIPRLFEKFSRFGPIPRPGESGTGLGLSITKKMLELNGGTIRVESVPHKGTRVIFALPCT